MKTTHHKFVRYFSLKANLKIWHGAASTCCFPHAGESPFQGKHRSWKAACQQGQHVSRWQTALAPWLVLHAAFFGTPLNAHGANLAAKHCSQHLQKCCRPLCWRMLAAVLKLPNIFVRLSQRQRMLLKWILKRLESKCLVLGSVHTTLLTIPATDGESILFLIQRPNAISHTMQ